MKQKVINIVLWLAFGLAMAASVHHLAWTFGTLEQPGYEWAGWIPALGVDAGLAALAYTIQQRKKAKRDTRTLWFGVVGFAAVSALANAYHALAVEAANTPALSEVLGATLTVVAKVVLLSATLPVAYIFLGEIVSGDDAAQAKQSEAQAEREQARADRAARAAETQEQRLLLEAENERNRIALAIASSEQPAKESETGPVVCENCGRSFRSINAKNAHKCTGAQIVVIEASTNGNAHAAAHNGNGRNKEG